MLVPITIPGAMPFSTQSTIASKTLMELMKEAFTMFDGYAALAEGGCAWTFATVIHPGNYEEDRSTWDGVGGDGYNAESQESEFYGSIAMGGVMHCKVFVDGEGVGSGRGKDADNMRNAA
ncbi:hypothetical protein C0995_003927 [Termitomyces sp. Mi166|nr:hypothetical protein C0995_003927 [Termitomyces sp. Mi166\